MTLHAPHQKLQNQKPNYYFLISEKPLKKCAFKSIQTPELHWQARGILRRSEQLLPIFFCRRVSTLALQKLGRRKKVAKTVKDERSDG
jgi:hypothetical protein